MPALIATVVVLALVFGAVKIIDDRTGPDPRDTFVVIDNSNSFRDFVGECPGAVREDVETAVDRLDRLRVASFSRSALNQPWAYDRDYYAIYHDGADLDGDGKEDQVEVDQRDEWTREEQDAATAKVEEIAAREAKKGSVALEQLERIAKTPNPSERKRLVVICSDGEVVDDQIDVREEFDREEALRRWLPRLKPGLQGAEVVVVHFGRGMKLADQRRAEEFLTELFEQVDASLELDPGVEQERASG